MVCPIRETITRRHVLLSGFATHACRGGRATPWDGAREGAVRRPTEAGLRAMLSAISDVDLCYLVVNMEGA